MWVKVLWCRFSVEVVVVGEVMVSLFRFLWVLSGMGILVLIM